VGYLEGYDDGFPTSAPVMSFAPNEFGIYDLGGNVWEWCEDWFNLSNAQRVVRGGSWHSRERSVLQSSRRGRGTPGSRSRHDGFRIVVVPGASD